MCQEKKYINPRFKRNSVTLSGLKLIIWLKLALKKRYTSVTLSVTEV